MKSMKHEQYITMSPHVEHLREWSCPRAFGDWATQETYCRPLTVRPPCHPVFGSRRCSQAPWLVTCQPPARAIGGPRGRAARAAHWRPREGASARGTPHGTHGLDTAVDHHADLRRDRHHRPGYCNGRHLHQGGKVNDKKLYFSLEGVDINDDEALAAFAQQVWEQASAAFTQPVESEDRTPDDPRCSSSGSTGDSHE